jgi:hypothetical protein
MFNNLILTGTAEVIRLEGCDTPGSRFYSEAMGIAGNTDYSV